MERPSTARPADSLEAIDESVDAAVGDDGDDSDDLEDAGPDEAVIAADDTGMIRTERDIVRVEELGDVS